MNRDETIALFGQGREAWNAWSERLLAERKRLEEAGSWCIERDHYGFLEPNNNETRNWMEAATADFSRCIFALESMRPSKGTAEREQLVFVNAEEIDFRGFVFPGEALFECATFPEGTFFRNASFSSDVLFDHAIFSGGAFFSDATFLKNAKFRHVTFSGVVSFSGSSFSGDVRYEDATFEGPALFFKTTFAGSALFGEATFLSIASFENATFPNFASFAKAKFLEAASFGGAKVERAFNLTGTSFSKVPSFNQVDFKQAPDLDSLSFPLPRAEPLLSGDPKVIPLYRQIRRMAIQGADYEREQMAFKGEMRSRRWSIDKFWHPEGFFGWCYDWAADCGRSIVRPFAIWLLSVFVFAVLYLPTGRNALDACVSGDGSIFVKSLYISGRNALVLSSGGKDDRITKAYQCLFGGAIPDSVSFVESFLQVPLSAVLIFLFLLAVKNRFKIK